mmetsp:Transcript_19853/g.46617  ORF Transcript_19853/g.46617 Transcript_19853/m.46617 type:complete len:166 (+) Transcript_19853:592-1089(+)
MRRYTVLASGSVHVRIGGQRPWHVPMEDWEEISAGNDHTLYLALVDTAFDCTKNNTADSNPRDEADSQDPMEGPTEALASAELSAPTIPKPTFEYLEPLSDSDDLLLADWKRPQTFSTPPSASSIPPKLHEKNQPSDAPQNERSVACPLGLSRVMATFAALLVLG